MPSLNWEFWHVFLFNSLDFDRIEQKITEKYEFFFKFIFMATCSENEEVSYGISVLLLWNWNKNPVNYLFFPWFYILFALKTWKKVSFRGTIGQELVFNWSSFIRARVLSYGLILSFWNLITEIEKIFAAKNYFKKRIFRILFFFLLLILYVEKTTVCITKTNIKIDECLNFIRKFLQRS